MSQYSKQIGEIVGYVESFIKNKVELAKIDTSLTTAKVVSSIIYFVLISSTLSVATILLLIALAFYIGSLVGSNPLGFVIVGVGIIVLCILLILLLGKALKSFIADKVITELDNNEDR